MKYQFPPEMSEECIPHENVTGKILDSAERCGVSLWQSIHAIGFSCIAKRFNYKDQQLDILPDPFAPIVLRLYLDDLAAQQHGGEHLHVYLKNNKKIDIFFYKKEGGCVEFFGVCLDHAYAVLKSYRRAKGPTPFLFKDNRNGI